MRSGTPAVNGSNAPGYRCRCSAYKVTPRLVSFGSEAAKYGLAPGGEVIGPCWCQQTGRAAHRFVLPALLPSAAIMALQRPRFQRKVAIVL